MSQSRFLKVIHEDTIQEDTIHEDTINENTIHEDTLHEDTIQEDIGVGHTFFAVRESRVPVSSEHTLKNAVKPLPRLCSNNSISEQSLSLIAADGHNVFTGVVST